MSTINYNQQCQAINKVQRSSEGNVQLSSIPGCANLKSTDCKIGYIKMFFFKKYYGFIELFDREMPNVFFRGMFVLNLEENVKKDLTGETQQRVQKYIQQAGYQCTQRTCSERGTTSGNDMVKKCRQFQTVLVTDFKVSQTKNRDGTLGKPTLGAGTIVILEQTSGKTKIINALKMHKGLKRWNVENLAASGKASTKKHEYRHTYWTVGDRCLARQFENENYQRCTVTSIAQSGMPGNPNMPTTVVCQPTGSDAPITTTFGDSENPNVCDIFNFNSMLSKHTRSRSCNDLPRVSPASSECGRSTKSAPMYLTVPVRTVSYPQYMPQFLTVPLQRALSTNNIIPQGAELPAGTIVPALPIQWDVSTASTVSSVTSSECNNSICSSFNASPSYTSLNGPFLYTMPIAQPSTPIMPQALNRAQTSDDEGLHEMSFTVFPDSATHVGITYEGTRIVEIDTCSQAAQTPWTDHKQLPQTGVQPNLAGTCDWRIKSIDNENIPSYRSVADSNVVDGLMETAMKTGYAFEVVATYKIGSTY